MNARRISSVLARVILIRAILVLWLAWCGSVALLEIVTELGTNRPTRIRDSLRTSEDVRMERAFTGMDREDDLPRGYHQQLFRALVGHVEPSGVILVRRRLGQSKGRALAPLNTLVAPRALHVIGEDRQRLAEDKAAWILDFRDELRPSIGTDRSLVASGPDWSLWR